MERLCHGGPCVVSCGYETDALELQQLARPLPAMYVREVPTFGGEGTTTTAAKQAGPVLDVISNGFVLREHMILVARDYQQVGSFSQLYGGYHMMEKKC